MDIFMLKAYRYRLYPKGKQIEMLAWHFGHTRHVYNWALKLKIRYYRLYGKNISKRALQDRLVRRKRRMKYQWLNDVNSQSLLSALFHLDTAYNNFFSGRAKYPRFKTKKSNWHSFQCPQHVNIHQDEQRIDLPKIKGIKAVIHRPLENGLLCDNQATTIAFEDLHIKGMIKNRKLSRHIADVAWSMFIDMVSYKADWQGKNVIYCGRYQPSSKRCTCGYINHDLKLKDRVWSCSHCSREHDRDILAATNIKEFAIADALGQSVCVKQFPYGDRFSKPAISKGQEKPFLTGRKKPSLEQLAV
jgi:IS605 OrfB family transposase